MNLLQPPIALTIDRVKSEFAALRKQNQLIQIGVCRCSNQSLFNHLTIKHLGALTIDQFENLAQDNRKSSPPPSIVLTESKKFLHLFSNKKKSASNSKRSSARDSGFVENDGKKISIYLETRYRSMDVLADHSLISISHKHRSKISSDRSDIDGSVITQKGSNRK